MRGSRKRWTLWSIIIALFGVVFIPVSSLGQNNQCVDFQRLIKETYTFKPSRLSQSERTAKSKAMDGVWSLVKKDAATLLPCLRAALTEPNADAFFRFDGSNLLMSLDPSPESTSIMVRSYANIDLADVDLRVWVGRLALLGAKGFDISEAADKWLRFPRAFYFLPEHGAYRVSAQNGAMFLYGSMDEAQATPALLKVVSDKTHPGREIALWGLMNQATPESLRVLRQINAQEFSSRAQKSLKALLSTPQLFEPREKPKTTRQEFVTAFERLLEGDWRPFIGLVSIVPDGERDVVAVLKPEDLPLVRKVRRRIIANGNPHAIDFYNSFSTILMTFISKPTQTQ